MTQTATNRASLTQTREYADRIPRDVRRMYIARAQLYKDAPNRALAAIAAGELVEATIQKHPGQILLHVTAIEDLLERRALQPGLIQPKISTHVAVMEEALADGTRQLWAPSKVDARMCGMSALKLADVITPDLTARFLSAVSPLFHNPETQFKNAYAYAGLQMPSARPACLWAAQPARYRALTSLENPAICDDLDDPWNGHECERPAAATNARWEYWMENA